MSARDGAPLTDSDLNEAASWFSSAALRERLGCERAADLGLALVAEVDRLRVMLDAAKEFKATFNVQAVIAERDAAREALATETRNAEACARERDEARAEVDDAIRRLKCERAQYTKGGSLADEITAAIERFNSDERYIESLLHVYTAADDDGAEIIRLHAEVQRVTRERDAEAKKREAHDDLMQTVVDATCDERDALRAEVERLKKQFELHRISVAASTASDAEEVRAAEIDECKRLLAGREAQIEEFITIAKAARVYVDAIEHGFASAVRPDVARRDLDAELRKAGY